MSDHDRTAVSTNRESNTSYSVTLPCEPDKFAEFMKGLLGKPQVIDRNFRGIFELNYEDVLNVFELINHRVHSQNEASLIQFTVSISYDDNSSVMLNSLEDFKKYTEIKPITSTGVTLSWVYLVKFRQNKAPERQQIDLTFSTGNDFRAHNLFFSFSLIHAGIYFRIQHTERTWGTDIEALLTGHIGTMTHNPMGVRAWVYKHSDGIGVSTAISLFLASVGGVGLTTRKFIQLQRESAESLIVQGDSLDSALLDRLNYIIELSVSGTWPSFILSVIFFILLSAIAAIFLGIFVASKADSKMPSFVLLSKEATKAREKKKNKVQRDWILFSFSVVISIVTGILSNVLFNYYFVSPM